MTEVVIKGEVEAPDVGSTWTDADDRVLQVTKVDLKDRQGGQVKGKIQVTDKGVQRLFNYSCGLDVWAAVWRDKKGTWKGRI